MLCSRRPVSYTVKDCLFGTRLPSLPLVIRRRSMDMPAFRAISLCSSYVEPVDVTKTSSGSFLTGLPRVVLMSKILETCNARDLYLLDEQWGSPPWMTLQRVTLRYNSTAHLVHSPLWGGVCCLYRQVINHINCNNSGVCANSAREQRAECRIGFWSYIHTDTCSESPTNLGFSL